jgi:hypothetical protein
VSAARHDRQNPSKKLDGFTRFRPVLNLLESTAMTVSTLTHYLELLVATALATGIAIVVWGQSKPNCMHNFGLPQPVSHAASS